MSKHFILQTEVVIQNDEFNECFIRTYGVVAQDLIQARATLNQYLLSSCTQAIDDLSDVDFSLDLTDLVKSLHHRDDACDACLFIHILNDDQGVNVVKLIHVETDDNIGIEKFLLIDKPVEEVSEHEWDILVRFGSIHLAS